MSSNSLQFISLGLGAVSYAFILLFIFNLFKVDYFNPVVKAFVNFYKPISKISIFKNQLYMIFSIAVLLKFSGFYLLYSAQYDEITLGLIAIIETVSTFVRIIFFTIIGSVILSWVSPNNPNPLLKLVEEISSKVMSPIRNFIPSFGGLDISPIFVLILVRQIEILLTSIIRLLI